jgi:hypothetical protein
MKTSYPIPSVDAFKKFLDKLQQPQFFSDEAVKLAKLVTSLSFESFSVLLDKIVSVEARAGYNTARLVPPKSSLANTKFESFLIEIYHTFLKAQNHPQSGASFWVINRLHYELVKIWGMDDMEKDEQLNTVRIFKIGF